MQLKKTENQFQHQLFGELTTITNENNEVFFLCKEVANILEYRDSYDLTRRLDNDEIIKITYKETDPHFLRDGINPNGMIILTESGLYSAILGSNKPQAKEFKKWVTGEVLPSIRKNGIYATDITIDKMISNPDFAIELLTNLKNEKLLRLEAEKKNAVLMHVNKNYTATEVAKELGFVSANQLNNILCSLKVQYKQNNTYVLYSKYAGFGYDDIKQEVLDNGKVIYHRKWTQLGRAFIIDLLKKNN